MIMTQQSVKKEDYGEAYYRRGLVNDHLNQHEEAVNDFTEAIRFYAK